VEISGRSAGRSARKRLVRQLAKQSESYSASGFRKDKSLVTQVPTGGQLLAKYQDNFIDTCQKELDRRSVVLGGKGCWAFFSEVRLEARKLGVERELRERTVLAASKFFGRPVHTLQVSAE
jgi:hypothetical protein